MTSIRRVEAHAVAVPLPRWIALADRTIAIRRYVVVRVHADEGVEGVSYAFGDVDLAADVAQLGALLEGEPVARWSTIRRQLDGATTSARAVSVLDVAVWDLLAKVAGLPLYRLLGGEPRELPAYVNGGYYRDGWGLAALEAEVAAYAARGFGALKMRVGRASPAEDERRVRVARAAFGDQGELIIDPNGTWRSLEHALELLVRIADVPLAWVEDPFPIELADAHRALQERTGRSIGAGESISDPAGFAALVEERLARVLQPDVTVVGGVEAWLEVARLAERSRLDLVPHFFPELHVHLAACPRAVRYVECVEGTDIVNFSLLLREPLLASDGRIAPRDVPGLGIEPDPEALAFYESATLSGGGR